ncbi:MAG: tRNA-dihydrouridine synthase [Propionibacteriaceae bacterium]|jgi:nifR3 family TIM-barrel protein|nr:tRNA-dihydrouridine synthase [Propionibacteriaceae bacterium]
MAGITNSAYRQVCREQAELGSGGRRPAGLFTCEMVTAAGLAQRIPKTLAMLKPDPSDPIRSVQLYGVEPVTISRAVTVCGDLGVDHIDLNFGCPVPKVTRKGGGGVLPWKLDRFQAILKAAVRAAEPYDLPVTLKTRIGIDPGHETLLDVGRIAQDCGIAAITLHARTVAQAYSGTADWQRIGELVATVDLPVFGNGDVWEVEDARRLVAETGCAGVAIGRGCLGRPWLFRDLAAAWTEASADHGQAIRFDDPAGAQSDLVVSSAAGRVIPDLASDQSVCAETESADSLRGDTTSTKTADGSLGSAVGATDRVRPTLGEVVSMVRRHAELLVDHFGHEAHAMADLRKHMGWYFKGFPLGGDRRLALSLITSIADIDRLTADLDLTLPYPDDAQDGPRGRQGTARDKVVMPYGWLDSRTLDGDLVDEVAAVSGG